MSSSRDNLDAIITQPFPLSSDQYSQQFQNEEKEMELKREAKLKKRIKRNRNRKIRGPRMSHLQFCWEIILECPMMCCCLWIECIEECDKCFDSIKLRCNRANEQTTKPVDISDLPNETWIEQMKDANDLTSLSQGEKPTNEDTELEVAQDENTFEDIRSQDFSPTNL